MIKTMYILTIMFLVLFIIDIIVMGLCACYIDSGNLRKKTIKVFAIKAALMGIASFVCWVYTVDICFGAFA